MPFSLTNLLFLTKEDSYTVYGTDFTLKSRVIKTTTKEKEWRGMFEKKLTEDPLKPQPIIVMEILQKMIEIDDSKTLQELIGHSMYVRKALNDSPMAGVCVPTAGELFTRLITRNSTDIENATSSQEFRKLLLERGSNCIKACLNAPTEISKHTLPLFKSFRDDNRQETICINGWNPSLFQVLVDGYKIYPHFTVNVMEAAPVRHGLYMAKKLKSAGVPCCVFLDSALDMAVLHSTLVICAVEAVRQDGAIIVEMGAASLMHMAGHHRRTLELVGEFYKITDHYWSSCRVTDKNDVCFDMSVEQPEIDAKLQRKTNQLVTERLSPSSYQTIYTDVGPVTAANAFENSSLVLT